MKITVTESLGTVSEDADVQVSNFTVRKLVSQRVFVSADEFNVRLIPCEYTLALQPQMYCISKRR